MALCCGLILSKVSKVRISYQLTSSLRLHRPIFVSYRLFLSQYENRPLARTVFFKHSEVLHEFSKIFDANNSPSFCLVRLLLVSESENRTTKRELSFNFCHTLRPHHVYPKTCFFDYCYILILHRSSSILFPHPLHCLLIQYPTVQLAGPFERIT